MLCLIEFQNLLTQKKETKDTKLRRVILYMTFLQKKKDQFFNNYLPHKKKGIACSKDSLKKCRSVKKSGLILKNSEKLNHKAQIIFLKKSSPLNVKSKFAAGQKENAIEYPEIKTTCSFENGGSKENNELNSVVKEDPLDSCARRNCNYSEISSYEQNPRSDEIQYTPNGIYQYLPAEKSHTVLNSWWEPTSLKSTSPCYNCCVQKKSEPEEETKNIFYESPLMSIENTCKNSNIQHMVCDLSSIDSRSLKEKLKSEQYQFENNCNSYTSYNNELNEPLPPVSVFLSKGKNSIKAENKRKDFLPCASSTKTKQSSDQLENYVMKTTDEQICEDNLHGEITSLPEYMYSTFFNSPERSAIISPSNEWVSDDTLTDSGSVSMSSSWESATSSDAFHNQLTRPNEHATVSTFNCDMHSMLKEKPCNSNFYADSNYRCDYGTLSQNSCNLVGKRYKMAYDQNNYPQFTYNMHQNFEKSHLPSSMFPPQNMSRIPFVVQKKREHSVDDYYVPHVHQMDSSCREAKSFVDSPNYYGNIGHGCYSSQHIKKEVDDTQLPEHEISYSFNNFSQWCPDSDL